jgi:hypothetical protein
MRTETDIAGHNSDYSASGYDVPQIFRNHINSEEIKLITGIRATTIPCAQIATV